MITKEFTKEREEEKPLTVGELMDMLAGMPRDMQLIQTRYSDYGVQTASMWSVVEAIPSDNITPGWKSWLMRVHPTMTDEQKARAQKYFHIEGN